MDEPSPTAEDGCECNRGRRDLLEKRGRYEATARVWVDSARMLRNRRTAVGWIHTMKQMANLTA